MRKESGAGPRRAESPGGEGELTHNQQFHNLAEDDEGDDEQRIERTGSPGPTKRWGSSVRRGRRSPWLLTREK